MNLTQDNANALEHIADFQTILATYSPSQEHKDLFASLPLVLLAGPTAAGRNTLITILVETGKYKMIVSDTTRKPRMVHGKLEEQGKVYWFKTEAEILQGLRNGEYIEAAIIHNQQVSGASIAQLKESANEGKIFLKEIEVNGVETYRKYHPNLLCIFLLPPTFAIWMQRLHDRGEMMEDEVRRRLMSAQEEIALALRTDHYQFVINNEIHEAAQAVDELAHGRQPNPAKQAQGVAHAQQLAEDISVYLQS